MRFFVGCVFALIACSVLADNHTTTSTSRILVHIPFKLHNRSGFEHVQAEFGFQRSSGSIAEYAYYTNETLCSPLDLKKKQGFPVHEHGFKAPFILVAKDDADCSSVTKARHAQQAGAAAFILTDMHCRCSDKDCTSKYPDDKCYNSTEPMMVNDGSGSDISIPSFMLFKLLGHTIEYELFKNHPVLLELVWGLKLGEVSKDRLPLHFHHWTTAHDPLVDLEAYLNLRTVTKAFADKADFAPRYALIDGSRFNCDKQASNQTGPCDHLCTNHGRYCTVHANELSGFAVVKETLRRLCIWKNYEEKQNGEAWWNYVLYHKEHCSGPHQYADENCLSNSMAHAQVDAGLINKCMSDTGDVEQNVTNTLLEDMLTKRKQSGVVALPAIKVNRKTLDYPSSYALFETICTEYWLSNSQSIPKVCETCGSCPNIIGCLEKGHCVDFSNDQRHPDTGGDDDGGGGDDEGKKTRHVGRTFFWLFVVAMIAGGGWYYYKQRQDELGNRVGRLQGYLQLSGEG